MKNRRRSRTLYGSNAELMGQQVQILLGYNTPILFFLVSEALESPEASSIHRRVTGQAVVHINLIGLQYNWNNVVSNRLGIGLNFCLR